MYNDNNERLFVVQDGQIKLIASKIHEFQLISNIQFLQDLCASEEEFQVFMSASSIPKEVINVCRNNFINREFVQNIKYFIDDYTYLQQVTLY